VLVAGGDGPVRPKTEAEGERGVADDETRIVLLSGEAFDVGDLGVRRNEVRARSVTLVIELRLTSTRQPSSRSAGCFEKSRTLRTGPSQEMARSGSKTYRFASRAYSTAETTLTSRLPAAIWRLSSVGTPSTSVASKRTAPRSTAPYTG